MSTTRVIFSSVRVASGLIAILAVAGRVSARDVFVDGSAQLAAALKAVRPGDVLTLKNGDWKDAKIVVSAGGEVGQPVEIRAEAPGGVRMTGGSLLALDAPYVTVDGLLFHGGAIAEGSVIQFNSHHGIVRNTAIVDYNPAAFDTRYYWVFFSGDNNVVDHCYFKGKSNLEPVIGNAIDDSRHNSVVHSLFKNVPYVPKANGREIIRVWGSGKVEERDDDGAYFTIDGNLFDHADGEGVEIVSLKSNHNVVQHNTVVATRGGLNIRRGNFNTVRENVVLGQGIDGADGLRMSGRDNVVAGNFVSGCGYGIRVACGEFIAESLTPAYSPDVKPNGKKNNQVRIPTYPQVVWLTLADNVVVASAGLDLEIGSDYKKHWPESQQVLLPENCRIENNRFVRPHGGASVAVTAADTKPPLDRFKFKANHFAGNVVVGASAAPEGFAQQPADGGAETPERYGLKPLTLQEVGPAWVIALRSAGKFAMEDAVASVPAAAPETPKKKKGG